MMMEGMATSTAASFVTVYEDTDDRPESSAKTIKEEIKDEVAVEKNASGSVRRSESTRDTSRHDKQGKFTNRLIPQRSSSLIYRKTDITTETADAVDRIPSPEFNPPFIRNLIEIQESHPVAGDETPALERQRTLTDGSTVSVSVEAAGRKSIEPLLNRPPTRAAQPSSINVVASPALHPEEKLMLVKRNRKLEQVLGETLSETQIGKNVVEPASMDRRRLRSQAGNEKQNGDDDDDDVMPFSSPETPFVFDEDGGFVVSDEEDDEEDPYDQPLFPPSPRPRHLSDPELMSLTFAPSHQRGPLAFPDPAQADEPRPRRDRPRSSIDMLAGKTLGEAFSGFADRRLVETDDEGNFGAPGPTGWLKKMSDRLGGSTGPPSGHAKSSSLSSVIPLSLRPRGLEDSIKNGVRVLIRQEKIVVREQSPEPTALRGKFQAQNSNLLSPARNRRRYSTPASPISPMPHQAIGSQSPVTRRTPRTADSTIFATDSEKRLRRAQLNKLNRLLGTRVPVELIISKQNDQTFTTAPLNDSQDRNPAVPRDREMTAEQKRRAVKLAAKMLQLFGEVPPIEAYFSLSARGDDNSNPVPKTSAIDNYRFSLSSLQYLLDNDQSSLSDLLETLDEEQEEILEIPEPSDTLTVPVTPRRLRKTRSMSSPGSPSFRTDDVVDSDAHVGSREDNLFSDRRKRAHKLSKIFGDPRVVQTHLAADGQGTSPGNSAAFRKVEMLERVLDGIEQGAHQDASSGVLQSSAFDEVMQQVSSVRKSISMASIKID